MAIPEFSFWTYCKKLADSLSLRPTWIPEDLWNLFLPNGELPWNRPGVSFDPCVEVYVADWSPGEAVAATAASAFGGGGTDAGAGGVVSERE